VLHAQQWKAIRCPRMPGLPGRVVQWIRSIARIRQIFGIFAVVPWLGQTSHEFPLGHFAHPIFFRASYFFFGFFSESRQSRASQTRGTDYHCDVAQHSMVAARPLHLIDDQQIMPA
jgi:hypothetical protein